MTRNVKRFLAVSLVSLTPSIALAGPVEFGNLDFLSQRGEYVSLQSGSVEVPVLRDAPSQSAVSALEDFYVSNITSPAVSLSAGYSLTATAVYLLPPDPLLPSTTGRFLLQAPIPPVTQIYYYTDNATDPTLGKTCVWQLSVTADANGLCTAQLNWGSYGGAICTLDGANSFVNPNSCETRIVTTMQ